MPAHRVGRGPTILRVLPILALLGLFTASCDAPDATGPEPAPPEVASQEVPLPANASPGCVQGVQPGGALYEVCFPATGWNGSMIVYAHGYVASGLPLFIPEEAAELAAFTAELGFGFASTSYRINGLAIPEGVQDVVELAGLLRTEYGIPGLLLLAGASEGGAVTTLAAEGFPGVFQGALSTCGPTGSFQAQLDYFGDFHVLFRYFFPGIEVGDPTHVPDAVRAAWPAIQAQVVAALTAHPDRARELIRVSGAAVDPNDPLTVGQTVLGILWYNVFATNDAVAKLGGTPFDNTRRWYRGSSNDFRLNFRVRRIRADAAARAALAAHYETSGDLAMPYVSIHTTGDEIVEFAQQPRYRFKALLAGEALAHSAFPVFRYGHCNFENSDLTLGLGLLAVKVGATTPAAASSALPTPDLRDAFRDRVYQMRDEG